MNGIPACGKCGLSPIPCLDDLLTMKRIANRPKDQLDVVAPEKIKRGEDPNV